MGKGDMESWRGREGRQNGDEQNGVSLSWAAPSTNSKGL